MFGVSAFAEAPFASLAEQTVVGVAITGVGAAGAVGTVVLGTSVAVTGVGATGAVGTIASTLYFYWATIDDGQIPNWQNINNSQTPGWGNVNDSQVPNWQNVAITV